MSRRLKMTTAGLVLLVSIGVRGFESSAAERSTAVSIAALDPPVPPNIPVTPDGGLEGVQNEEQVFMCPSDTSVIITNHRDFRLGYRQIGLGRSIDGGQSWTDTLMSTAFQIFDLQSDPCMTVRSDGAFVLCHLDFADASFPPFDSSMIGLIISEDCGETWHGPYTITDTIGDFFEDKQFITSDRTGGTYNGSVYVSWTRYSGDDDPTRIIFAASPDGGTTWGDTVIVGAPRNSECFDFIAGGQFSQPLVGKDGAIYVFWIGQVMDSSSGCELIGDLRYNKSVDGGTTWGGERPIETVSGYGVIEGSVAIYNQPSTAADISAGPHTGNLYVQYRDLSAEPPFDSDIFFRRSTDTGNTWTEPIRVNDDFEGEDVDQFHNWMVCNEEGILVSIWYDQRVDFSNYFLFDVFAAYSYDGGQSWTSNHRISDVSSDPNLLEPTSAIAASTNPPAALMNAPQAGLLAEYIGLACSGDKVVAVWTDTRFGQQDVMSATWYLPVMDPRGKNPPPLMLDTVACKYTIHWATSWKESEDLYEIRFADNGNLIPTIFADTVSDNQYQIPSGLPTGVELYWFVKAFKATGGVIGDSSGYGVSFFFNPESCDCQCDCHGDPICDQVINNAQDVVALINVAFRAAAALPDPNAACPFETTDLNCDTFTSVIDVVKVVNVAFRGADPLTEFCNPCQ